MLKINITNKFFKELFSLYNNMCIYLKSIRAFRMYTNKPKIH